MLIQSFLRKLLFYISSKKITSFLFMKFFLKLNTLTYEIISVMSIPYNKGLHPKHAILKYKEWFSDNITNNDIVLDIGSNTGELPKFLSQKAKYVYGIEIVNKHYLESKKLNIHNVSFIHADATTYDYQSIKDITTITLSNVLEHIEDRVLFLKKILSKSIFKNKKIKVLIRVPMITRDWLPEFKKSVGVEWRLDKTHFIEYRIDDFINEMQKVNIIINKYEVKYGEIYANCSFN